MAIDQEIRAGLLAKYRTAVNAAITKGTREALLRHKRSGNPIAVSRNGEVILLQPDDICLTGTSLDAIWNNTDDDIFAELLEK